jgi:hypothetical protein
VASIAELFRLKAIAASEKRLSRDWIDLYYLSTEHGFTLADFQQAFQGPQKNDSSVFLLTGWDTIIACARFCPQQ